MGISVFGYPLGQPEGFTPKPAQFRVETNTLLQDERLLGSENCDAFIVFRSFPSQENAPENSSLNWSSLKGSDHHHGANLEPPN